MIHQRACVRIVDRICEANDKKDMDELKIAAAIHDMGKYGKDGESSHTIWEHPLIGAEMWRDYCKDKRLNEATKAAVVRIARMIECHMGRFNKSKYSDVVLPKPQTMDEHILHWADMISCSSWFSIEFDKTGLIEGENPF